MQSKATTVAAYLRSLPKDRRDAVSAVREVILANLDPRYQEGMLYGMIGYFLPLSEYPKGYRADPKQPLPFAALASQKNYMSLYMMSVYCGCVDASAGGKHADWFRQAWAKTGKKLDMGKSCIRFRRLEDLPLDLIGEAVRRVPAATYIEFCESVETGAAKKPPAKTKARRASG